MSRGGTLETLTVLVNDSGSHLPGLSALKEGNNGSLQKEFDQVEREVPDDIPDPNNTDPSARDAGNIREAPVTECSDDG